MPLASALFHIIFAPLLFLASVGVNMLRRFSTFRKSKKEEENAAKVNGASNGKKPITNGSAAAHKEPERVENHGHNNNDQPLLEQFAQLVHASRRPLPTQSGDGAYLEHEVPSGVFADLKSLGFKDVKTLMQVMTSKKGSLQDDKTYLMERVIQASLTDI